MKRMMKCKSCGKETGIKDKVCTECGAKNKKPVYKKPWFIVLAFFIAVGVIGAMGEEDSNIAKNETVESGQEINENDVIIQDESYEKEEEENVPTEYKSALKKAKLYGDNMNMSKVGIYEQLTSEYGDKFAAEAAQYAIDNVVVDWNENALKKAKSYSDTMNMSKIGVYEQLTSEYGEQFTVEEAQYAIDNVVADWNANALKKAKSYQDSMAMSPSAIYDQLVSEYGEQFTAEEVQYAIDNLQ